MLNPKQRKILKALAHKLKPLINIGKNEISQELIQAVQKALFDHELIKIKVLKTVTLELEQVADSITKSTGAELVNIIGHTLILYKKTDKEGFENIEI